MIRSALYIAVTIVVIAALNGCVIGDEGGAPAQKPKPLQTGALCVPTIGTLAIDRPVALDWWDAGGWARYPVIDMYGRRQSPTCEPKGTPS